MLNTYHPKTYQTIGHWIKTLSRTVKGNIWLLTSRYTTFPSRRFESLLLKSTFEVVLGSFLPWRTLEGRFESLLPWRTLEGRFESLLPRRTLEVEFGSVLSKSFWGTISKLARHTLDLDSKKETMTLSMTCQKYTFKGNENFYEIKTIKLIPKKYGRHEKKC